MIKNYDFKSWREKKKAIVATNKTLLILLKVSVPSSDIEKKLGKKKTRVPR